MIGLIEPADLPDIEEVIVQWLLTLPALAGVQIGTRVPTDYNGSQSVVRVVRLGGSTDFLMWSDNPRLDIDCFGPDKATAFNLTRIVRRALAFDIRFADLSSFGACVTSVNEDVGPQWFDEEDYPNAGRYLTQISVMVHA